MTHFQDLLVEIYTFNILLITKFRLHVIILHCFTWSSKTCINTLALIDPSWEQHHMSFQQTAVSTESEKWECLFFVSESVLSIIGTSEHAVPTVTRQLQSTATTPLRVAAAERLMMLKTGAAAQVFVNGRLFSIPTNGGAAVLFWASLTDSDSLNRCGQLARSRDFRSLAGVLNRRLDGWRVWVTD